MTQQNLHSTCGTLSGSGDTANSPSSYGGISCPGNKFGTWLDCVLQLPIRALPAGFCRGTTYFWIAAEFSGLTVDAIVAYSHRNDRNGSPFANAFEYDQNNPMHEFMKGRYLEDVQLSEAEARELPTQREIHEETLQRYKEWKKEQKEKERQELLCFMGIT